MEPDMSHILDILGFYYRMPPMLTIDSEISGLFQNFWVILGSFRIVQGSLWFDSDELHFRWWDIKRMSAVFSILVTIFSYYLNWNSSEEILELLMMKDVVDKKGKSVANICNLSPTGMTQARRMSCRMS